MGQCPEPEPGAGGAIVEGFVSAAIAKKEETMKNERELQQRLAFFERKKRVPVNLWVFLGEK